MRATIVIDKKLWLDFQKWCRVNKKNVHGEAEAMIRSFLIKDERIKNETSD
ncbi:hypothetical protein KAH94_05030 [bacterium]|nr:hypothetical protein [bacterium]